jgi:hypothetical protein
MSAAMVNDGVLWTREDLAERWQAPGKAGSDGRKKWVRRRCAALGVHSIPGMGRGENARFIPDDVRRAEAATTNRARRK